MARDAVPVRLPPHRYDFAEQEGEVWIDWIKRSGVDVVGDVDDLRPRRPAEDAKWKDPDRVRAKLELGAALDALSMMTQEAANRAATDTVASRFRGTARRLLDR